MFSDAQQDFLDATSASEAFSELVRNTDGALLAQRASQRVEVKTEFVVRHANLSQRHLLNVQGVTVDVSNGGCMGLLPKAILPGDLYQLTFAEQVLPIGSLLALCKRCRHVRDDVFEVGFRFTNDIDLSVMAESANDSLL